MKIMLSCDWCGKTIERYPSQIKAHNFCSRCCMNTFAARDLNPLGYASLKDLTKASEHMHELNKAMNPTRMTTAVRRKIRLARLGTGEKKTYTKTYGVHTHRVAAEKMLGRPLLPGEVVHHKDENKWNNRPDNLMVFPSQSEHAAYHKLHKKRGDAIHDI